MSSAGPDLNSQFRERYRIVNHPAMRRAELQVIGSNYGATSYTTKEQADRLAQLLNLTPTTLLLDVGSGAGWPGNYLAATTGCDIVLTDPTLEGMAVATDRSKRDEIASYAVVARGDALPFTETVFDAATSCDVFC